MRHEREPLAIRVRRPTRRRLRQIARAEAAGRACPACSATTPKNCPSRHCVLRRKRFNPVLVLAVLLVLVLMVLAFYVAMAST